MSTEPIRILLADDDAIIRQGLANLLSNQENLEVVAAVSNGAQSTLRYWMLICLSRTGLKLPNVSAKITPRLSHSC